MPATPLRFFMTAAMMVVAASAVNADGLDANRIDSAARSLPRLHSLLVSRRGELVLERYYNCTSVPGVRGRRCTHPANIKSASKSVISALVGIAVERGLIAGVRTPIVTFFPELGGHDTCFAWGYGGQYAFVVPDLDLVIVTTASPDVSEERRGHRRALFDLLEQHVLTPVAER